MPRHLCAGVGGVKNCSVGGTRLVYLFQRRCPTIKGSLPLVRVSPAERSTEVSVSKPSGKVHYSGERRLPCGARCSIDSAVNFWFASRTHALSHPEIRPSSKGFTS